MQVTRRLLPLMMLIPLSAPLLAIAQQEPLPKSHAASASQSKAPIPSLLLGRWRVTKTLPTQAVVCWDRQQIDSVLNTQISYQPDGFSWNNQQRRSLGVVSSTVEEQEFVEDNSDADSETPAVDFAMLGIIAPAVERIAIMHTAKDSASNTPDDDEFPGATVLIKNPDTLIFSMCNQYFEAQRQR